MATRHILFLLLQEIIYQRSASGNRISSQSDVTFKSHSQIMTDMSTHNEEFSDNDTQLSDLNRERRYFQRKGPENDTRATSLTRKIDENLRLCLFKPTDDT